VNYDATGYGNRPRDNDEVAHSTPKDMYFSGKNVVPKVWFGAWETGLPTMEGWKLSLCRLRAKQKRLARPIRCSR
jgi:hypothetical protein